jgi:hypothetical protein
MMLVFILVSASFPSGASVIPATAYNPDSAGKIMAFVIPPTAAVSTLAMISPSLIAAVTPVQSVNGLAFDGTQSGWAEPEIQAAYDNGLTYPQILGNYKNMITREEFCTIVVKLF